MSETRKRSCRAFLLTLPRCWSDKSRTGYDVKEVLDHLPPKLAEELMDAMYKSTIARVPLFKDLDEAAMHEICLAMKPLIVLSRSGIGFAMDAANGIGGAGVVLGGLCFCG